MQVNLTISTEPGFGFFSLLSRHPQYVPFIENATIFCNVQDVEIDASEEDLPMEWVKKRRANGSIYYFNVLTGAKQATSPNDLDGTDGGAPAPTHGSATQRIFQVSGRKEHPAPGWRMALNFRRSGRHLSTLVPQTR